MDTTNALTERGLLGSYLGWACARRGEVAGCRRWNSSSARCLDAASVAELTLFLEFFSDFYILEVRLDRDVLRKTGKSTIVSEGPKCI